MEYTITVTDPASGRSVSWQSDSKTSVLNQARIEVAAGAKVKVENSCGIAIFDK